jgi:anti-sigma regulatory factor (Ser/Thr protein kinase)
MIVGHATAKVAAITRADANVWWVAYGEHGAMSRAKVELDVCGAWATVSNQGSARPIAVRRAGWVDLRGNPVGVVADDRIGLGPGDALVLWSHADAPEVEDDVLRAALGCAGAPPEDIACAVGAIDGVDAVAVGVPDDLGIDPAARVTSAVGARIRFPGYPLGDLQPELWREPPTPPRMARMVLTPDLAKAAGVRQLLDRLLASWRLNGRVDENDLKLVATELTTNAIVHAAVPETVTIRYLGDVVRVEVADASAHPIRTKDDDAQAESGRGLHIVDALATDWGVDTKAGVKRVWCDIGVTPV